MEVSKQAKKSFNVAFRLIDAGVKVEERNGRISDALSYYRRGISVLDKGLSSPSSGNEESKELDQLRSKMTKYRTLAAERVASLSSRTTSSDVTDCKRVSNPLRTQSIDKSKSTVYEKLKNFDKKIVQKVLDDVLTDLSDVSLEDIAGNETVKEHLRETIIYPALRPELFTGLRSPVRGILLFGPPGNGKTMLAKAVAKESKHVFLNISAASILSKWVGESERYVKVLFAVARALEPTIIFLDEIDALLAARKEDGGNTVGRRVLTQFLSELDGVGSGNEKILVLGATNRPHELDDAALRRFPKRLLVPMPDHFARVQLLTNLLKNQSDVQISKSDIIAISRDTEGYSASDLTQLAKDAALGPIRV